MNKKIGILISILLIAVVGFAGTMYFVSQKIDPETIKKIAVESIEKALPGSSAEIEKIDYSMGTSVTLEVKKLNLKLKKSKQQLLGINELQVKIPLLAIFTSGGTIDIITKAPKLHLKTYANGKTNWERAIGAKVSSKKTITNKEKAKKNKKTKTSTKEIPSFLSRSQINIRVTDTEFKIIDSKNKKSQLTISKFLLKNIGLKKPTAFEIRSHIDYLLGGQNRMKTNLQLVGELDIKNLTENGKLKFETTLNLSKTSIEGQNKIPDVKGRVKIESAKDKSTGHLEVKIGNLVDIKTGLKYNENIFALDKLNFDIELENLKEYLSSEQLKLISGIKFNKSVFNLQGQAKVKLGRVPNLSSDIKFGLTKKIFIDLENGVNITNKLNGSFKKNRISIINTNETFDGTIISKIQTRLNPMKVPSELSQFSPINIDIDLTHLRLKKTDVQSLLYKKKEGVSNQQAGKKEIVVSDKKTVATKIRLPKIEIKINGSKIFLGEEVISLQAQANINQDKFNININDMKLGHGVFTAGVNGKIHNLTNIDGFVESQIKNVDLKTFNVLLPPFLSGLEGVFNGEIKGQGSYKKPLTYDLSVHLNGKNGEIKNLNMKQFILPLVEKISVLKDKVKDLKITDKFKLLNVSLKTNEKHIKIKTFNIVGHNDSINLNLAGGMSMMERNSELKGNLIIKKVAKDVTKITGENAIPLLLEGKGFSVLPNSGYTIKKLLSRSSQKKIDSEKKKINAKIKKEKKKLENKLKNEAKKLLKGFKF